MSHTPQPTPTERTPTREENIQNLSAAVEAQAGGLQVGDSLGKYRLIAQLGEGGMGVVYRAEDTILKRPVALKLLPPSLVSDRTSLTRFLSEAQAAARLNHPNAVTVHEVGEEAGHYFIVMELLSGGSCGDIMEAGRRLPWQEATRIAAEVCRALGAAHVAGLIHRDVKPANILLGPKGVAKLGDFGLAKVTGQNNLQLTGSGQVVGTPSYMSPEQCRGEPLDGRTDLYALGATWFALLTGRPPFEGEGAFEVMFAHCSAEVPDPREELVPSLPESCLTVARRALAKKPAERYQHADEMRQDLLALLGGSETDSLPPLDSADAPRPALPEPTTPAATVAATRPIAPVAVPPKRRGRSLTLMLTAAGIVLGAGLGLLLFHLKANPTGTPPTGGFAEIAFPTTAASKPVEPPPLSTAASKPVEKTPVTIPARKPVGPASFGGRLEKEFLELPQNGRVEAIAFSPDGKLFAAGRFSDEMGVTVWDFRTGRVLFTCAKDRVIRSLAFSKDSSTLATGGNHEVSLWSTKDGSRQTSFMIKDKDQPVRGVALSPDGNWVAAATGKLPQLVASVGPGKVFIWDRRKEKLLKECKDQADTIRTVDFSPDSKLLASASHDKTVCVYEVPSGNLLKQLKVEQVTHDARFSPDGQTLLIGCNGGAQFWERATWQRKSNWRFGITTAALGVAYSPDGTLAAAATGANQVEASTTRLWDVHGGRKLNILLGHQDRVWAVAFSPDGRVLATGSADKTVRLWDLQSFRQPPRQ